MELIFAYIERISEQEYFFYMLKAGASGSSVVSHAGISSFWIYRYNKALTELKDSPVNLVKNRKK